MDQRIQQQKADGGHSIALPYPQALMWTACLLFSGSTVPAATRYVDRPTGCIYETGERNCAPPDGPFLTIGRAVRQFGAMLPGDTLFIRGPWRYSEPIVLNKPMEIHAYDGPVIIGPVSLAPFDLVAEWVDQNGLPLNPKWGAQITNPGSLPDQGQCPGGLGCSCDPGNLPCTQQYTETDDLGCGFFFPHVNWFGCTYEGTLRWNSKSPEGNDDDYSMFFFREDKAGYTAHNPTVIECEFSSDETIDHFNTPWWNLFHAAVDSGDNSNPQSMLNHGNGAYTIITGLVGLDCGHVECNSELHPVWTLAMNVEPRFEDDLWVFFVRNWGNEGFCGRNQHFLELPTNQYTVSLPWKTGATNVMVLDGLTKFNAYHTSNPPPSVRSVSGQAVYVTFYLDAPRADGSMWDGELHLQWTQ